jgi:hypothetical protein
LAVAAGGGAGNDFAQISEGVRAAGEPLLIEVLHAENPVLLAATALARLADSGLLAYDAVSQKPN